LKRGEAKRRLRAMTAIEMNGAHALIAALELHGVDALFGVPGHGAYPIYDALNDFPRVRPFVGRNEQGATFAAEGFARATGRVAVATSVPKAGLTNAATGLWEANDQPSRLLFLLEADPSHRPILEPIARYYRRADRVEDVAPAVHELMWALQRGRPGAAALEVPNEVLNATAAVDASDGFERGGGGTAPVAGVAAAVERLRNATRVVIVAGAPAVEGAAGLVRLAERLRAPVFVDGRSKGAIPDDHQLALGWSLAPNRPGARLIEQADVVVLIGDASASAAALPAERLLRIDWDDAIATPAASSLFGSVPSLLDALAEAVPARDVDGWSADELDEVRAAPFAYARERVPWSLAVWEHLRAGLPRDALVFTDSLFGLWTARLFPAYEPRTVSFPHGTGTLGHAVPAALGARLAFPEREIVAIAGDGAFLYNPQELATMMLYRQKIIVIVANDDCYGAIKHNMGAMFGRSIAHELRNPDFLTFGHAFDMASTRLRSIDDLPAALQAARENPRSSLIELPLELRPPRF
jgi:thiamine pyrophosphate-dependent acetolactate synthase large subunit-like protein